LTAILSTASARIRRGSGSVRKIRRGDRPGRPLIWFAAAALIVASMAFSQGLQYEPPVIPGHEPPFRQSNRSPFAEGNRAILKNESKMFTDTANIDFEKRQLTLQRVDADGNAIWNYHYGELNDYITDKKNASFYDAWYDKLTEDRKAELGQPAAPRLQWELAVHYPPWAQRLLGNEPPKLKIEGRLQLTVAYERTKTWTTKEDEIIDVIPIDFSTNYEFALTGSVGRLISVNITHTKQDGFDLTDDPLKNFKVEYKESYPGELEDEIIQEIVAGYMGFDMPGTNLSGYSDKADGLFGIKMRAKLGPLMLTAMASHAQGEAISKELGGKNDPDNMAAQRESEYIRNRYFFVDRRYKEDYNIANNIMASTRVQSPRITDIQLFVSILCSETSQSTTRRYMSNVDGNGEACYRMLEENTDYTVDRDRGFVRFDYAVKDDEVVAITMRTADGSITKGTIVPTAAPNNSVQNLALLKPRNLDDQTAANTPEFDLMWRNVYYLGDLEDAKLDMFWFDPAVGDTIRHTPGGRLISDVMGLTDDQGRARLEKVEVFNAAKQELIIPPWSADANGNEPFANPALGTMADARIYRFGSRTSEMRDYVPKYGMLTGGAIRRTSYDNLGWNILPGTVTVKTNSGTLLIEGEDYDLDYQMGVIDLLSARARAAESVVITYQRESDFVLEKKVLAGLRGEMRLPFISDNSFMAASVLYQNAATSADDIPLLGNEPFSKLHLSFNTSLDFEPEWMTKAVGLLPFVKAEQASAAKLDFEIVRSRTNTNTSKDQSAYLDDFERTRNDYSLSLRHSSWYNSHFPFSYTHDPDPIRTGQNIAQEMLRTGRIPAWDIYWYTPSAYDERNRITRYSVWQRDPRNPRHSNTDNYIDVLRLHTKPASEHHPIDVRERFDSSYAAITTSFGRNGINMENHRYLEMVVNPKGTGVGRKGKLMVQIGTFSHDQVRDGGAPNGRFDLEDTTFQNRPELISQFDRGLNKLDVADKFYVIPNASRTGWDTLSRTQNTDLLVFPRSVDNPSGDIFRRYDRDNLGNYRYVNGTCCNSIDNTENIDLDGVPRIGIRERYYSYEIDLDDESSPYIDREARVIGDWRVYRIPLKEILGHASIQKDSASAGGTDWLKARGMRLVWYDFDTRQRDRENELLLAGLELVGNYWEPSPGDSTKIEATSISNFDNMDYYESVFGSIVRPKSGEMTPKEQSLRLNFFNLNQGDTATVRRNMGYYSRDISGYEGLSVKVYDYSSKIYGDDLKFVMRFGSDDSTFYEYTSTIPRHKAWNDFEMKLQDFSDLKLAAEAAVGDEAIDISRGHLRVRAPKGRRPNFKAITFMAFGVSWNGAAPTDTGEIWVNELVLTGARTLTGVAARVNVTTQWSDFLSMGAGLNYTAGDFRTMSDMTVGNEGRSELSANVNAKMQFDKFLPERWGVSIPVGGALSGGLSRPTVRPQSDILLLDDDGRPDGFRYGPRRDRHDARARAWRPEVARAAVRNVHDHKDRVYIVRKVKRVGKPARRVHARQDKDRRKLQHDFQHYRPRPA